MIKIDLQLENVDSASEYIIQCTSFQSYSPTYFVFLYSWRYEKIKRHYQSPYHTVIKYFCLDRDRSIGIQTNSVHKKLHQISLIFPAVLIGRSGSKQKYYVALVEWFVVSWGTYEVFHFFEGKCIICILLQASQKITCNILLARPATHEERVTSVVPFVRDPSSIRCVTKWPPIPRSWLHNRRHVLSYFFPTCTLLVYLLNYPFVNISLRLYPGT